MGLSNGWIEYWAKWVLQTIHVPLWAEPVCNRHHHAEVRLFRTVVIIETFEWSIVIWPCVNIIHYCVIVSVNCCVPRHYFIVLLMKILHLSVDDRPFVHPMVESKPSSIFSDKQTLLIRNNSFDIDHGQLGSHLCLSLTCRILSFIFLMCVKHTVRELSSHKIDRGNQLMYTDDVYRHNLHHQPHFISVHLETLSVQLTYQPFSPFPHPSSMLLYESSMVWSMQKFDFDPILLRPSFCCSYFKPHSRVCRRFCFLCHVVLFFHQPLFLPIHAQDHSLLLLTQPQPLCFF